MKFFLENVLEPKLPEILHSLTHIGATSIPILRDDTRKQLVHTAQNLSYQQEAEEVGKDNRLVRQQVASCEDFSQTPIFLELRDAFQNLLDQSFKNFIPFLIPSISIGWFCKNTNPIPLALRLIETVNVIKIWSVFLC